jgi:hypothetical protein
MKSLVKIRLCSCLGLIFQRRPASGEIQRYLPTLALFSVLCQMEFTVSYP